VSVAGNVGRLLAEKEWVDFLLSNIKCDYDDGVGEGRTMLGSM
jgi:hypothetical protein